MSTITVQPYRINLDGSVSATGTAASALEPQWGEVLSEPGSGSVSFLDTDPILDVFGHDGNDLIQFLLDGTPAWVMVPDPEKIVAVSQGEAKDQRTTFSGPGLAAVLDRMRVWPTGGVGRKPKEKDRFFNWTNLDYDDGDWDNAKDLISVGGAKIYWPVVVADDYPWHETLFDARMIWADNPFGNPSTFQDADVGHCWFRKEFSIVQDGRYRVYFLTDNKGECYVDGQSMIEHDSFQETRWQEVDLTVGTHMLAVHVENLPNENPDYDPGGFALTLFQIQSGQGIPTGAIVLSDSTWLVKAYQDDPPGMTPGKAFLLWFYESQARGVLPGASVTFDEFNDSNGTPWDETADIATPVNNPGYQFVRELAATYIDFRFDPDLSAGIVINAYRKGEMGTASGVTLAPLVNVTSLEHQRNNLPADALLIETPDLWLDREDAGGIALYGRIESGIEIGSPASNAEVYRVADGQLAEFARPREQIDAGAYGPIPYVDCLLGDTAVVPDSSGDASPERVIGFGVTQNQSNGQAVFSWSFRDVVLGPEERVARLAATA